MDEPLTMHFNVGIFGFHADERKTGLIKSISSLLHEVRLRVADHNKPEFGYSGGDVCLDLFVCPALADDIWLLSLDSTDTSIHCVLTDAADKSNPFVQGASSIATLGGGAGNFNGTHTVIQHIATQADMIIALWDGDDQSRNGMIWNLLCVEVADGIPCVWIDINHPDEMNFFDRYTSEPFSSARFKEYIDSLYAGEQVESPALQGKPVFLSGLWEKCYSRFINKYKAQVKQLPYVEDVLLNPAFSEPGEAVCRQNQQKLAERFGFFDGIAFQVAKKYRESIYFRSVLPFVLTIAISVGFYIETLLGVLHQFKGAQQNFWMFVAGIGFLLHALINVYGDYISRSKEVKVRHSSFLKARYLAEYMRVAAHFLPFGIPLSPAFSHDRSLTAQVRCIFRSLEPADCTFSQSAAQNVLKHSLLLINDQITYHTNTRARLKLVVEKLEKNSKRMLWLGFAIVFLRGLLQFAMPFLTSVILGEYNGIKWISFIRSFSNMLALLIPAWAGYFSLKLSLNNFRGLYNHSDEAIKNLARLKDKAEALAESRKIPYEMLAALSQDILSIQLKEVEDWYMQTAARTVTRL